MRRLLSRIAGRSEEWPAIPDEPAETWLSAHRSAWPDAPIKAKTGPMYYRTPYRSGSTK